MHNIFSSVQDPHGILFTKIIYNIFNNVIWTITFKITAEIEVRKHICVLWDLGRWGPGYVRLNKVIFRSPFPSWDVCKNSVDCLKRHQAHVRLLQSKPCRIFWWGLTKRRPPYSLLTKLNKSLRTCPKTNFQLISLFTVPYFFVRSLRYSASFNDGHLGFRMYRGDLRRVL